MVHIIIEGNIGVGKTSLLEAMKETYGSSVKVFPEPVKKVQCCAGENLLSLMYNDPKRWSFTFQKAIALAMMKIHMEARKTTDAHTVTERSIFGTKIVFVEHLKNKGLITKMEHWLLEDEFNFYVTQLKVNPDIIVYLRAPPEVCLKRIQERGRPEEKKITLDYLKGLHDLHERWLAPSCNHCHNDISASKNVIVIDANQSKSQMLTQLRSFEEKLFSAQ
ncbi:deoxynucleoside kinase [Tetranychus urticae]|uniref:deoxynucleoside kinase n=1 Tax=Tetranychus urticae TaxID=32264 RepID=UPI00077BFF06|nr:deoxynucleoside kinase [Tetranychus urticae]